MKKIAILVVSITMIVSCKDEEPFLPSPTAEPTAKVGFIFKQYYDGQEVSAADFGTTTYTNAKGTNHTISKLQYLVSNITLHKTNGDEVHLGGYNFVDVSKPETRFYTPSIGAPEGNYTGITITFGFNEEDNVDGAYKDLNAASWAWPAMIGGGYHFMKFEGMFTDNTSSQKGFAYHNGTASKVEGIKRINEPNSFTVRLWDYKGGFTVKMGEKTTIDINMNIAEWFKNPIVWDLDQYHAMLMPNYAAQKMMNQNGRSVFSLGNKLVE